MQIKANHINSINNNKLNNLYLFFGQEHLLINESLSLLRKKANKEGFTDRLRFDTDISFNWDNLIQEVNSPLLFSSKRIIECHFINNPNIKAQNIITDISNNVPNHVLLIFVAANLTKAQQNNKWLKTIDKNGIVMQYYEIQHHNLVNWINSRIQNLGLNSNTDLANIIAYYTEGNLLASNQELEKLKLTYPEGNIDVKEYEKQIEQQSKYNAYGLVNAVFNHDFNKIAKIIRILKFDDASIHFIVPTLKREILQLMKMAIDVSNKIPTNEIFKKYGIWQNRKILISKMLNLHNYMNLQEILIKIGRIDRSSKGFIDILDVWDELLTVCLTLAGKNIWTK